MLCTALRRTLRDVLCGVACMRRRRLGILPLRFTALWRRSAGMARACHAGNAWPYRHRTFLLERTATNWLYYGLYSGAFYSSSTLPPGVPRPSIHTVLPRCIYFLGEIYSCSTRHQLHILPVFVVGSCQFPRRNSSSPHGGDQASFGDLFWLLTLPRRPHASWLLPSPDFAHGRLPHVSLWLLFLAGPLGSFCSHCSCSFGDTG